MDDGHAKISAHIDYRSDFSLSCERESVAAEYDCASRDMERAAQAEKVAQEAEAERVVCAVHDKEGSAPEGLSRVTQQEARIDQEGRHNVTITPVTTFELRFCNTDAPPIR